MAGGFVHKHRIDTILDIDIDGNNLERYPCYKLYHAETLQNLASTDLPLFIISVKCLRNDPVRYRLMTIDISTKAGMRRSKHWR